jgi:hypothetical protein
MTKLDTAVFTGRSGREYEFRIYVWENEFIPSPAVYVVTERTIEPGQAPAYRPLYVSQTPDISGVFENHPKNECFQLHYANTIAIIPEADESERVRIEEDLIAALQPPCNTDDSF